LEVVAAVAGFAGAASDVADFAAGVGADALSMRMMPPLANTVLNGSPSLVRLN
jgi:hypothetical protein